METKAPGKVGEDGNSSEFSIIDGVQELAKRAARRKITDYDSLNSFLCHWWCQKYNKPLKDPLLHQYTLQELLYEYYLDLERNALAKEVQDEGGDKMEEQQNQADIDWAEQEERRELEEMKLKEQSGEQQMTEPAPSEDDIAWMEKKLKEEKEKHGSSFGEDIDERFD